MGTGHARGRLETRAKHQELTMILNRREGCPIPRFSAEWEAL
jgi:hypothetical protein